MTKITYGEVMTVEEFEANCNMGAYIDYDGSGFYCDGEGCFLVFPTEAQALAHLPKNRLDREGHGTEYSVKPIELIGE